MKIGFYKIKRERDESSLQSRCCNVGVISIYPLNIIFGKEDIHVENRARIPAYF